MVEALSASQRDVLAAACVDVLADLAAADRTVDEAGLARHLHRATGVRLAPGSPGLHAVLQDAMARGWETYGVLLPCVLTGTEGIHGAFRQGAEELGLIGPSADAAAVAMLAAGQRDAARHLSPRGSG